MNRNEIYRYIRRVFLFSGMAESDVARIALRFKPVAVAAGECIYRQGDPASAFYVVAKGAVRLTAASGHERDNYGLLTPIDFFGIEELSANSPRMHTVCATKESLLLRMRAADFAWMLQTYPQLKNDLTGYVKGIWLAHRKNFSWLNRDEVIRVMARKHVGLLWYKLSVPAFFGGIAFLMAVAAIFMKSGWLLTVTIAGVIFTLACLWALWITIDWENDYYIVTNQRVVWLEKVIGLYESRREAPLNAVLSVNVASEQAQRMIGTGDVVVRTYTGSIMMKDVDRPEQFTFAVDAYWKKAQEASRHLEKAEIQRTVHEHLHGEAAEAAPFEETLLRKPVQTMIKRTFWQRTFGNFLKMRFEEGDSITYRKHWYVLIRKSWKPLLVLVSMTALVFFLYLPVRETRFAWAAGSTALVVWGCTYLAVLLWWFYDYLDWRNDIYVLTGDKLYDIERKPLGREEKKVAPLGSVLSLEHTREGILGLMLNFGNVIVNVGSAKLIFYGVHNPAGVQNDIFDRMYMLKKMQEDEQAKQERERMMEWLDVYHKEIQGEGKEQEDKPDFY